MLGLFQGHARSMPQKHASSTPRSYQKHARSTPEACRMHAKAVPGACKDHTRSTPGPRQEQARSTPGARLRSDPQSRFKGEPLVSNEQTSPESRDSKPYSANIKSPVGICSLFTKAFVVQITMASIVFSLIRTGICSANDTTL